MALLIQPKAVVKQFFYFSILLKINASYICWFSYAFKQDSGCWYAEWKYNVKKTSPLKQGNFCTNYVQTMGTHSIFKSNTCSLYL